MAKTVDVDKKEWKGEWRNVGGFVDGSGKFGARLPGCPADKPLTSADKR